MKKPFRSKVREFGMKYCSGLYDRYSDWVRTRLPAEGMVVDGPGFQIEIDAPQVSVIGRSLYRTGIWEPEVTDFVRKVVEPGWHMLDIGAHIGYYTLLFAKRTGEGGRVVAFEPMPRERAILERNILLNNLSGIGVFPYALSDRRGHAVMAPECRGQMRPGAREEEPDTVEMLPLDSIWNDIAWERLDMVKVDVEGAEMGVLQGMQKVLERFRPNLLLEIHPLQLKAFDSSAEAVVDWLRKNFGYAFTPIDSDSAEFKEENLTLWGSVPEK
ncbi:MAG: FkbM family methyltransferase [Verrucomicrobiota bacterium]|nr:FkbM family methyltransferase [Verrucomicrobiota bacterium]